jgi:hypothetical protein
VLLAHAVLVPFLMLHWALANDTCALTWLEAWLRGTPCDTTFLGRLFGPVYLVSSRHVWAATAVLWGITLYRLRALKMNRWMRGTPIPQSE